jgi:hypothetical protein
MSLHEHPCQRPIDPSRIQTQILAAMDQRILEPIQKQPERQDRTRQQHLELGIRRAGSDQLIGDPLSLARDSTQAS